MTDWQLGIDFGTSYTVVAVAADGVVSVVDVESNGRSRLPSSVFLNFDGEILVGTAAQHQAVFAPERYEPTPKRSLGEGEIFLGDRLVPVTDLAAAVLRRVYTEACRQQGETTPAVVRVTHPADWGDTRLRLLHEAVEKGGLPKVVLVPEPVAAAARIGLATTQPGQTVAVYDFGGGTFDAAVLRRTAGGFELAGPPAGRDPLGGEDIDQRIINYLGEVVGKDNPEAWAQLMDPPDVAWRRNAAGLRTEVQRAKETLSEVTVCQLWAPGLERDVQLTRAELEKLIGADIDATVDSLQKAIEQAGLAASDLHGVYLVGGSSRIPLVADTLWRRLGVRPSVQDNPKSVTAMGAAGWDTAARPPPPPPPPPTATAPGPTATATAAGPAPTAEIPVQPTAPMARAQRTFGGRLAMHVGVEAWQAGCTCVAELVVDYLGHPPATIRVRNEPTTATDVGQYANQVGGHRQARTPGYRDQGVVPAQVLGRPGGVERRFLMSTQFGDVAMFERYLLLDGRALVLAAPEPTRALADQVTMGQSPAEHGAQFESDLVTVWPQGWAPSERVTLRRNGVNHSVVVDHVAIPTGVSPDEWRKQQFDALFIGVPGASMASHVPGPVLNHFAGEILTVRWDSHGAPMLTKRGLAVVDGHGYVMTIALPFSEQRMFAPLARHARLRGDVQGAIGVTPA